MLVGRDASGVAVGLPTAGELVVTRRAVLRADRPFAIAAAAADSARAGGKCRTEALALMLLTDIELDEALLARYRHRLHILKTQRPELSFF